MAQCQAIIEAQVEVTWFSFSGQGTQFLTVKSSY